MDTKPLFERSNRRSLGITIRLKNCRSGEDWQMDENMESNLSAMFPMLEDVLSYLTVLVRLLVPAPTPDEFNLKDEQREVYILCDSMHTINEIVKIIGKPANQIRMTLTRLRRKGLVQSVKLGGRVVYFRVPAIMQKPSTADAKEST